MLIEDFEEKFGCPSAKFTKAQWREIALSFLEKKKPGRPKSANNLNSETVNVQALAWEVKERMDAQPELKKKAALQQILREAIKKEFGPASDLRLNGLLKTYTDRTYKRVREHLATWKKGEIN